MSKTTKVFVSMLLTGSVIVGAVTNVCVALAENTAKPSAGSENDKIVEDARRSLPDQAQLPEFDGFKIEADKNTGISGSEVAAGREADKAYIRVTAIVTDTEERAKDWVQMRAVKLQSWKPFDKGNETGREIGEECWNSNRGEGPPQSDYTIIARDGRAIVKVMLVSFIPKPPKGTYDDAALNAALHAPVAPKDVRMVEDQAIEVLAKLTATGYTSKSKK